MSDVDARIEELEQQIQSLQRGDGNAFIGFLQGLGLVALVLTVGELAAWYLNWFCVWLMYWLVVHILPFRIVYDLRLIVWAGIYVMVGFINIPQMSISKMWESPNTKKATVRKWTFVLILIPGLIVWLIYFIISLIYFPW